jgi:hypothetical protein
LPSWRDGRTGRRRIAGEGDKMLALVKKDSHRRGGVYNGGSWGEWGIGGSGEGKKLPQGENARGGKAMVVIKCE